MEIGRGKRGQRETGLEWGVEVCGALCEIRSCPGATKNSWEVAFPQASSWEKSSRAAKLVNPSPEPAAQELCV